MGAWADFLAKQHSDSGHSSTPSILSALKARPIRTLLISVSAVGTLTFLLAASGGPGSESLKSTYGWIGSGGGGAGGSAGWFAPWGSVDHEGSRWDTTQEGLDDPVFTVDPHNGLEYPPDVNPLTMNHYKRARATFVALVRNSEQVSMMSSMRGVEDRFNRKFGYPWVFLNDQPFTEDFKRAVRSMTRSKTYFGVIPTEHWSYPDWVDQDKARFEREKMGAAGVIYGGSESYRHMCRFNSGFFYRHELLQQFDYYWRVEPGVEFYCDIDYDPFLFMEQNNKTYGFTIAIYEYRATIESLWDTVREFAALHPNYVAPHNSLNFMVDDMSKGLKAEYNLCHFWSNFEIADMRFWRSKIYSDFFDFLDRKGGFFYERWGDAPVHSIAAALFLPSSRIHQFDDIAYHHNPYTHCPVHPKYHENGKCFCDPKGSFDLDGYSCMQHWWRVGKRPNSVF